jgi:hypothetical protein
MSIAMLQLQLLHTSPLASHFHWEYQALVLLALTGLWLFLAGRTERCRHRADRRAANQAPTQGAPGLGRVLD